MRTYVARPKFRSARRVLKSGLLMSASLAAPAQILREVFGGTGASFSDADPSGGAHDGAVSLLRAPTSGSLPIFHRDLRFSLGLTGLTGGAFLIAIAALIVSWQSLERLDSFRTVAQAIDTGFAELPRLKTSVEAISTKLDEVSAAQRQVVEISRPASDNDNSANIEIQQKIDSVDHKIDHALDDVKAHEAKLDSRLDKVEANQTAQSVELDSLRLRTETTDAPVKNNADQGPRPLAGFHLKSVKAGVAVVEGPDGVVSVSVGDTLSSLGKVLKITKVGRRTRLVTEQGTLALPWRHVVSKHRRPEHSL